MVPAPRILALFYPALLMSLGERQNYTSLLRYDHNYVIFPDEEGRPYLIDLNEDKYTAMHSLNRINSDLDTIKFTAYTRNNLGEGHEIILGNAQSIIQSAWNPKRPTRFVTHGWKSSADTKSCTLIRDSYLIGGDYNVIVMDWSVLAGYNYLSASWSVPEVANRLAQFIDFMHIYGDLEPSETKIVGHSLGAHVAGLAARNASVRIAEVVGLDPAKPMFSTSKPGERIDATDADYVQIIHTHAGVHGLKEAIGTSDFYPNGGASQPGCDDLWTFGACSHARSYIYFAESILNETGFKGTCMEEQLAKDTYCISPAFMGGPTLDKNARGAYTLKTAEESPFALG